MREVSLISRFSSALVGSPVEVLPNWLDGDFRTAWFCRWVIAARQRELSSKAAERGGIRYKKEKKEGDGSAVPQKAVK